MKFCIKDTKPNKNGRVYSKEILTKIAEQINNNPVLGEIGRQGTNLVYLGNTSHECLSANVENDSLWVDIEPLPLPNINGEVLNRIMNNPNFRELIKFELRGLGDVDLNGNVTDYTLISIDVVPND